MKNISTLDIEMQEEMEAHFMKMYSWHLCDEKSLITGGNK